MRRWWLAAAITGWAMATGGCGDVLEFGGMLWSAKRSETKLLERCAAKSEITTAMAADLAADDVDKAVRVVERFSRTYGKVKPEGLDPSEFATWLEGTIEEMAAALESEGMSCTKSAVVALRTMEGVRRLQAERGATKIDVDDAATALVEFASRADDPPLALAASLDDDDLDRIEARYSDLKPGIETLSKAYRAAEARRAE
ncbi:MAG: hypothetical protein AAF721_02710 [Myxococcota bacterium]